MGKGKEEEAGHLIPQLLRQNKGREDEEGREFPTPQPPPPSGLGERTLSTVVVVAVAK